MLFHVTARTVGRLTPFLAFEAAAFAWARLRATFPETLAAVLMPNHLHLIIEYVRALALRRRLGALLSGLTRSGRLGPERLVWQPVPEPKPVLDLHHLRRQVRYVALNPCRRRLCADPLLWVWSTYRDVMGAVAEPWVTADRLAAALGLWRRGFEAKHHAYVTGDPAVRVDGTPPPLPAPERDAPVVPLEAVAVAAAAAVRLPVAAVSTSVTVRRLFVHLARQQGWRDVHVLARRCDLTPRQVRNVAATPTAGLDAARVCLGDPRLTAHLMPAAVSPARKP